MEHENRSAEELNLPNHSTVEINSALEGPRETSQRICKPRKDRHCLHAMRNGILSRYPLQALARLGENTRRLRRMERRLRADLKPSGVVAEILFDRLWSSYLRCLLAARAEEAALFPNRGQRESTAQTPTLVQNQLPTLIWNSDQDVNPGLSPDLFREFLLIQRYDAHFSREMFRCLSLLVLMKKGGEAALEQSIENVIGTRRDKTEVNL